MKRQRKRPLTYRLRRVERRRDRNAQRYAGTPAPKLYCNECGGALSSDHPAADRTGQPLCAHCDGPEQAPHPGDRRAFVNRGGPTLDDRGMPCIDMDSCPNG